MTRYFSSRPIKQLLLRFYTRHEVETYRVLALNLLYKLAEVFLAPLVATAMKMNEICYGMRDDLI